MEADRFIQRLRWGLLPRDLPRGSQVGIFVGQQSLWVFNWGFSAWESRGENAADVGWKKDAGTLMIG